MTELVPGFQLAFEPDGGSFTVRENLVDIIEREILGPAGGPEELLPVSPRQLYLVGHIAPVKLTAPEADPDGSEDGYGLVGVRADAAAGHAQRGIPAEAADGADIDGEEDDVDDKAPKQGLMIPSSMGLRFQVPNGLAEFTVTASWGTYESVKTDEVDKRGRPVRRYRRTPVGIAEKIAVPDLTPGRTYTRLLSGDICLRIDAYDDAPRNRLLIEIALVNDRKTPPTIPVNEWLFQTKLHVDAGGAAVFLPVRDVLEHEWPEQDDEVRRLHLQYRNRLEFAVGRTCSVDWKAEHGARRATAVWTTWLPVAETPQTRARSVKGALLGMDELAKASPEQVREGLRPLVDGYADWLDGKEGQSQTAASLPEHLRELADEVIEEARAVRQRLTDGLAHVVADPEAFACLRFMNEVMRDQRIHSQISAKRSSDPNLSFDAAKDLVDEDERKKPSAWRPFQLAFILMQLPALTDPTAAFRSGELARVELLFFPTGGGKTEAYLGLAAYTFAIRRRQQVVSSSDGPLDGRDGVAVLMRYTLRLLTAQQFQRATALVCAAELARRRDVATWGGTPFRIGLWVGTDVSPKRWDEADEQLRKAHAYGGHRLTVLQVQRCPWCGSPISAANVKPIKATRRVLVFCGDDLGRCPFAQGGEVDEGLPMLTVDEEIYRMPPAFVIATVDKFARLAREGEAASLFGYVGRYCGRHGYVHPDYAGCDITTGHKAEPGLPAATVRPVGRLRPPDLIIQDELHLITGALGTAVGLFEVAVETLASWETADGVPVRPMIVASTATVRRAEDQVRGLYGRGVEIFPPQVLDVADTYFSQEVPIGPDTPGRRYIGVSAQGVRLSSAEIRVAEVLLQAGQLLFDRSGAAADPYMTLVGYFNATRELAGMARYVADDVQNRVRQPRPGSGFPRRVGSYGRLVTGELTSRIASVDIGRTLDNLSLEFDPDYATTAAMRRRIEQQAAGEKTDRPKADPFDVVLATSMLQVGVDVQRLGLMLVVGQPKNTAEYIQASSRVGRDAKRPGLVVSLGNWARPRDLAHYEQFRHYHETFYSQVEALSVTPFSPTALDRGIDAVLVSAARVIQAHRADGLSPERSAWRVRDEEAALHALIGRLYDRMKPAAQMDELMGQAYERLINRLDQWNARGKYAAKLHKTLVYERTGDNDAYLPLLISPENAKAHQAQPDRAPFVVAHSMREVQPEINLLVSPLPDRLVVVEPDNAPGWELPEGDDA
ncbi:DISARM system helicase DrmA [Actinoplanes siamensis]|uniref:Helicase n=1 Tax=Actinoplanes siamensis TaxID=1223317 RepID=A0A919TPE2_9ACTN|nr:DISARM system helicase DrmA [Actinoplanes siamensis]GIF09682.1 helicase [Actinoplanes siamensis]